MSLTSFRPVIGHNTWIKIWMCYQRLQGFAFLVPIYLSDLTSCHSLPYHCAATVRILSFLAPTKLLSISSTSDTFSAWNSISPDLHKFHSFMSFLSPLKYHFFRLFLSPHLKTSFLVPRLLYFLHNNKMHACLTKAGIFVFIH